MITNALLLLISNRKIK